MLVGTGSDVGKSWIVTGICRWLKQAGYSPAPFKAQNMSLNSFSTLKGEEIGRAQAVQAEACGIPCCVEMNPILLKPSSESKSQVVLNGKPIGDQTAREYFLGNNKQRLFEEAKKAFRQLAETYAPIVMEGAGSISELNLKHRDIVNLRMAEAASACVYLVADIDRGGVFGSVYGTIALLEPWERQLMRGIIINKFRGDAALFEDGRRRLEELTGLPVLGVLPYAQDIEIEEEDSVALATRQTQLNPAKLNVAVVRLDFISNYTDFQPLEQDERMQVVYTQDPAVLRGADVIVLPGSKNTLADLQALHERGLVKVLQALYPEKPMMGICGGYQMMGHWVEDPHGVESSLKRVAGLGIFEMNTTLAAEKQVVQRAFQYKDYADTCQGYEIHMGHSTVPEGQHLNRINGAAEGYHDGKQAWGTYLHGIFDNSVVVNELLALKYPGAQAANYRKRKEENYDRLAAHISQHLDLQRIMEDVLD